MPKRQESTTLMAQTERPAAAPQARRFSSFSEASSFIWSIADLLRGDYKQYDFGKVILPFTVLRRLDGVLADTKAKVIAAHERHKGGTVKNLDPILNRITGVHFHNTSKLDFKKLLDDPNHIAANLNAYVKGFSESVREIFIERFKFPEQVSKLDSANVIFLVVQRFADVDLSPETIPNHLMGSIFEDLIRRFAEQSNETAGEHFTPREVIRLMVNLLFMEDKEVLTKKGVVKTMLDPACGTGGMLSVAEDYLAELNPDAHLEVFGQELNDESYAICKADMLIKAENPENVIYGNSFSKDGHAEKKFDYLISNPPFGVEWKKVEKEIKDEAETQGHAGRFGAGLPRINDGSFLFLQHMISKMKPAEEGGSRIAIVFNGSPLFTGDAGSGESNIRQWIIENDWLEAIVALPEQLFFNTAIFTYVWIVTNRKSRKRKGKVQLVNAVDLFQKMKKSLGEKRNRLGTEDDGEDKNDIKTVTRIYGDFKEGERSKIFANDAFGYRRITVERPLRLSFRATSEHLERLREEGGFKALATSKKKGKAGETEADEGKKTQEQVVAALGALDRKKVWRSRDSFEKDLEVVLRKGGLKLGAPAMKAVLGALGDRDEEAEVCKDAKGRPESDADLRDNENVPLTEKIEAYFEREVKPHVPDAWIDEEKTKVGYEIPFTRHFYKYLPLRPLEEIEGEIRTLEGEIQAALGEVLT